MAIIKVKNLTKKYGQFRAVDKVNFQVKDGETFGILGPNGAGKTTTLEMIEGLRSITSGKIEVDGIDVGKNPNAVKNIIGVQLQSSSYFDHLTIVELVKLFASFYGRKVDPKNILSEVGLEEKSRSYVDKLSGGQQQRLSIASTLVNDPKIIFLDEPTTGLDPQARHNVWELITKIRQKGHTIVLTTHYMDEAEKLCDQIAIMDQGKIIDLDTPQNLIKKHGSGTIISFKSVHKLTKKFLEKLPAVKKANTSNHHFELLTSDEIKTLKKLIEIRDKYQLLDLTLRQSTLEDVFLNLTGKKLRE